jgi:hypothetical protein
MSFVLCGMGGQTDGPVIHAYVAILAGSLFGRKGKYLLLHIEVLDMPANCSRMMTTGLIIVSYIAICYDQPHYKFPAMIGKWATGVVMNCICGSPIHNKLTGLIRRQLCSFVGDSAGNAINLGIKVRNRGFNL